MAIFESISFVLLLNIADYLSAVGCGSWNPNFPFISQGLGEQKSFLID